MRKLGQRLRGGRRLNERRMGRGGVLGDLFCNMDYLLKGFGRTANKRVSFLQIDCGWCCGFLQLCLHVLSVILMCERMTSSTPH